MTGPGVGRDPVGAGEQPAPTGVLRRQTLVGCAELADVLHDEVLQHLAFARQELLEQPGATAALRSLDAAADAVRRLIQPAAAVGHPATRVPLVDAVHEVVAVATRVGRIEATVDVDAGADWPASVDDVLRVAVRELVVNVVKHAGAASLSITLRAVDGAAELVVVDDGAGIDLGLAAQRAQDGHRGLSRLRQRVARAGGALQVQFGEDGGTIARVHLPA